MDVRDLSTHFCVRLIDSTEALSWRITCYKYMTSRGRSQGEAAQSIAVTAAMAAQ